ncbi:MAG TPA: hypothetical protein DCO83_06770, partial [Mucilaginibacter sp.]|nr:hypothetical protein [Mucilaginibacter sp.]
AKVQPRKVTKTSKWLVPILSVLMLIFLITSIWEFIKNRDDAPNRQIQVVLPVKKAKNKQEIKLQQVIDKSNGHTLLLSDYIIHHSYSNYGCYPDKQRYLINKSER